MIDRTSLGHWIRRFLLEYAASERNLSPNTCASYRDMLVLLLPYVAKSKGAAVDTLAVADLSAEVVRSFLAHLEGERQCVSATRNQRLGSHNGDVVELAYVQVAYACHRDGAVQLVLQP